MRFDPLLAVSICLLTACANPSGSDAGNNARDDSASRDQAEATEEEIDDDREVDEDSDNAAEEADADTDTSDARRDEDDGSRARSRDAAAAGGGDAGARSAADAARSSDSTHDAGTEDADDASSAASDDGPPDAAKGDVDPSESAGVLAELEGKTPYSSKPTGAATWLVDPDASATQRLIDDAMEAAGNARFAVFSLYRYYPNSGTDAAEHARWVGAVAEAIARNPGVAVVVLEPDAFALGTMERRDVDQVLDQAVGILKDKAENAAVFLDVGHSDWLPASTVLSRARLYDNYERIDGWATNTSNFQATEHEVQFARRLFEGSEKPSIIDTSRNGLGRVPSTIFNPPASEWDPGPRFAWHPDDPAVLFNYYNKPSDERD